MKSKAGIICIALGALLLSGSLILSLYNRREDVVAQETVAKVVPQIVEQIQQAQAEKEEKEGRPQSNTGKEPIRDPALKVPVELLTEEDKKMTEVEIDGHYYIGCLSIPALELELPIMSDWSYSKLRVSPCRYNGTVRGEDLVLMAHNYKSHFGYISQLKLGDRVVFTDMDGNVTEYKVVGTDVLEPTAVETVTSGDYDLTLFTCTYGGKSRVTVYCDKN